MFKSNRIRLVAMGAFVCASAFAQTASSSTSTQSQNLGPFGIGSTETARVSLTNVAANASSGTAASCTGSVTWINAAGTAVGTATNFTIASGVTSSISLPFASSGATGARGEFRALLSVTRTFPSPAPCSLAISLETFDTSSGATHIYEPTSESFGGGGGH